MKPMSPFSDLFTFAGFRIFESPDRPRYQLPEKLKLPCGVDIEWPAGFREDFNKWALAFLGTTNMVPPGMIYAFGHKIIMRPEDVVRISNIA